MQAPGEHPDLGRRRAAVLLALGGLCACGPGSSAVPESSRWLRLAPGTELLPLAPLAAAWNERGGPLAFRAVETQDPGLWVDLDWEPPWQSAGPGKWRCPRPAALPLEPGDRAELVLDGRVVPLPTRGSELPRATLLASRIEITLPEGEAPPARTRLSCWVARGWDGRSYLNRAGRELVDDALVVWPGERLELVRDLPPLGVLRYRPRLRPLVPEGEATFRVELGGALLHETTVPFSASADPPAVEIPLGGAVGPGARLAFEVRGAPAVTAFAIPVVSDAGPVDGAAPSADPERPDLVMFLADTFRADLMEAYGGDPADTPALNALAARGVCFLQARSTSTWTLPAHASLFTGLWPPQHAADRSETRLAPELETLAELFLRSGYRTAAVTEGIFLTPTYGLDQGFETFHVQRDNLSSRLGDTLGIARELTRQGDGRPLFLFVHTYRTHWPYATGVEEDLARAIELRRKVQARLDGAPASERVERLAPMMGDLHALYREGARALDAQVGPFLGELEQRGFFERGLLVFASDHGDAFQEHGGLQHGIEPYEELARVPLFLFGGGLEPRKVTQGASLVDLAPTLARRYGLEPDPRWPGCDLLALAEERLLFNSVITADAQYLAVLSGPRKVLASGRPALSLPEGFHAAFALDSDPLERENLLGRAEWAAELARVGAEEWQRLAVPRARVHEIEIDAERQHELRMLGYGE